MSYIISANNNIPRISKSVDLISEKYGKEVIFEDIPDDWCCPICGVSKDMFKRLIENM